MVCCLTSLNTHADGDGNVVSHPRGGYTVYVVPHSHIDLEWFWTYEEAKASAIRILRQALAMLKKDPRYTFTQDQMQVLQPFWESITDVERAELRHAVEERRFEVVSGMLVQPDVNEPGLESLTRQFLVAKPWMEQTLGAKIQTGWNIDTFGQTVQMPQLFRAGGMQYFVFMRDWPPDLNGSARNLFYWRSPDGSTVLAHQQSDYAARLVLGRKIERGSPAVPTPLDTLIRRNPTGNDKIMLLWGYDTYLPNEGSEEIEKIVRHAASRSRIPIKSVLMSTPTRYFEDIKRSGISLPTYTYDFNPPLQTQDLRGLWAQRPGQKLAERRAEDALQSSEKIASIAHFYGMPFPSRELTWGWQRVLYNQSHDTMAGSHADAVNEAAMSRYNGALEMARQVESDALFQLSRKIDTSRSGEFPLVVFNALSFPRTEVVAFTRTFIHQLTLTDQRVRNFRILDSQGQLVPFRVTAVSRLEKPAVSSEPSPYVTSAAIEFLAKDVPAFGYRVYRVEPTGGAIQAAQWHALESDVHNSFFQLQFDDATGVMTKLVDVRRGTDILRSGPYGGNELVFLEEDNPDMEGTLSLTGREIRGDARPRSIEAVTDELGTTVRVQAPFLGGERVQEVRLHNQMPRIDFKTTIKGFQGHDGLLAAAFQIPRDEKRGTAYETHGAVVIRPDGIYDANTWVDVGDSSGRVSILNRGSGGHQIDGDSVRVLLLRSITDYEMYYAPNASETGDHVFEYALYPHSDDWSIAGVMEQAHSFNSPLRVLPTDSHEGLLPAEHSFLSIESGHFEVTALKKAEHGEDFILRGQETQGKSGKVRLRVGIPIRQAWRADLLESPGEELALEHEGIEFECHPFELVTVRLRTEDLRAQR